MRSKLLLPLIVSALLGQACIELPGIEPAGETDVPGNETDAGVTPQKQPPELTETRQTATSVPGGGGVTLGISARDPQDSALGFSWEASAGVLGNQTSTNTSSEVTWTAPTCGSTPSVTTETLTATVTNALGLSTSKRFSITARCQSPEVTETQQSATVTSDGETVMLHLTARDPQNSALGFSWHSNAGSLGTPTSTATGSEVTWATSACTSSSPKETTAIITGTVTNALGLSTSASFNVTATCPKWFSTPAMVSSRTAHTATLLNSGKVLVAGGASNIATAEMYSPTGTWSSTSSMVFARAYHTATLLNSGKVLVTGGSSDGTTFLQTAEIFDPATGNWSSTGSMASARYRHTSTLLPSGKVLVTGGYRGSGDPTAAETYDPAAGTWSSAGNMTTLRSGHTATLLNSGTVLVAGYGTADLYNPATGAWRSTPRMVADRSGHTATLLSSGKVLVVGGVTNNLYLATAEVYDPITGTWTSTGGDMATTRAYHTATLLPSGKVLVAGGQNKDGLLSSAEVYDPQTGTWAPTISMLAARASHSATLLPSGKVLVTGWANNPTAEIYEP
ncbi:kelch repeat-containing protein [Archangium sp.]|uniref:Kelch repeat-containing protein n=1 Tax=Archangium sp. TaxID=1872627 RepID=UPI00389A72FD